MRILVLVLALAAVAFAAKYALDRGAGKSEHTAARRDLDNVRDKAKDLERQMQKAADDAARNSEQR